MKDYNNILIAIGLFFISNVLLFGQDTIYTMPSEKEITASVLLKIEKSNGTFKYSYQISSGKDSRQNIYEFFLEYNAKVDSIISPTEWDGRESNVIKKIISWGSIDSTYDILPNNSLGGFNLFSSGLPRIQKYYLHGYAKPLSFPAGEAPDLSQIKNWDIFENALIGFTISPANPPNPYVPLAFLDSLISYKHQAFALGWLKNKKEERKDEEGEEDDTILKKLDKRLDKARKELVKGDSTKARKELEKFVKKVEELYKESMKEGKKVKPEKITITNEAYALLKYNAEYLIDRLQKKEEKKDDDKDKD